MTLEKFAQIQETQPLYLRFGKPPKTGHSHDANNHGKALPGVCCLAGKFIFRDSDYAEYEIYVADLYHTVDLIAATDMRLPAYLLTGREVGRDPGGGGPLIKPSRWWKLPNTVDFRSSSLKPRVERCLAEYNASDRKTHKATFRAWKGEGRKAAPHGRKAAAHGRKGRT